MEKQIAQVGEFHQVFGVNILEAPGIPSSDRCRLRQDIFQEEVRELQSAIDRRDLVLIADGIVDCMYVLIGTAHEFGLAEILEKMFNEVHRSNMSKLDENGKPVIREDGKVLKSKLFTPPNLFEIINRKIHSHV